MKGANRLSLALASVLAASPTRNQFDAVRLSDVFIPEVFESYTNVDNVERNAFVQSGVLERSDAFNSIAQSGGSTVTMPFWNDLDASTEPNYSNDDPADLASPDKLGTGEQVARTAYLNNGWSAADLVKELAGSNPNERIANRIDNYWDRQLQKRILAASVGLYNANVAQNGGDMVVDVTAATLPADQVFTSDNFIDAVYTLGDRAENIKAMAVHSMVVKRMVKEDDIEFVRDSEGKLLYQAYKGVRLIIDDSMPTTGSGATRTYLSILFGQSAFGMGEGTPLYPTETDRAPRAGHGGGVSEIWSRKTWLIHPRGYKFTSTTLTGNGTESNGTPILNANWADLQLAVNWQRQMERKQYGLAFLKTKG